ncbi:hypothetical protein RUND412_006606, partial [Rhizina undulata]
MKKHLGFKNNKGKNRKRRCFSILQIISESLILACTTTTRNSKVWEGIAEEDYKYFLPVDQTPEIGGRRAITVQNDWEGLSSPEIEHIQSEARAFAFKICWGNHLPPKMSPGSRESAMGQLAWNEDQEFIRLSLEANVARIRHSSKFRKARQTGETNRAISTPIASDRTAENCEATSTNTITAEKSMSGPPRNIPSQRPSQINVLTPGPQTKASSPPPSPHSDSGYESSAAVQQSGNGHSMSRSVLRRFDSPWRRSESNSAANSSSSDDGFQLVQRTRKSGRRAWFEVFCLRDFW